MQAADLPARARNETIGKAPSDATSIGSLDGVIYFGSVTSGVWLPGAVV